MNKIINVLVMVLTAVFLTGCLASAPVIEYRTTLVIPEDQHLQACAVAEPPDAATYPKMTAEQKEKAMADYANAQTKNLTLCNNDKAGLRAWKIQQKEKYEKTTSGKKGE